MLECNKLRLVEIRRMMDIIRPAAVNSISVIIMYSHTFMQCLVPGWFHL